MADDGDPTLPLLAGFCGTDGCTRLTVAQLHRGIGHCSTKAVESVEIRGRETGALIRVLQRYGHESKPRECSGQ